MLHATPPRYSLEPRGTISVWDEPWSDHDSHLPDLCHVLYTIFQFRKSLKKVTTQATDATLTNPPVITNVEVYVRLSVDRTGRLSLALRA